MIPAPMKVEVINTGSELLLGTTLNTHLGFIAQEIFGLGLRVQRQITVPDGDEIRTALVEAFSRAEIVFVTGGLGPPTDDITREIVAELLGLPLGLDAGVLGHIKSRYERRNFPITERVYRQAQVPHGATVFQNANGTAPGLYIVTALEGRPIHLFLLPGPPRELKPMVRDQVMPILQGLLPGHAAQQCRIFHVLGVGESLVEEMVGAELLAIEGMELG